mmetsp:Transcript_110057/g.173449  ORF Transcript_110057/g.173449 Transcript_110057/m.173449 type:complete len:159 (-) Transcript_110057:198-674(-)
MGCVGSSQQAKNTTEEDVNIEVVGVAGKSDSKVFSMANPFDDAARGSIGQIDPDPTLSVLARQCAEYLSTIGHFENNCEDHFKKLRKSVLQGSEPNLQAVPDSDKEVVWNFLVQVAERRRFLASQASEVSRRLETNSSWVKVLSRNANLQKLRDDLLG